MADLRALCATLGFRDVKTYIQSGNVAFEHNDDDPVRTLKEGIEKRFGFEVPVMVCTRDQLISARDDNTLPVDGKLLHVVFSAARWIPTSSIRSARRATPLWCLATASTSDTRSEPERRSGR